MDKPGDLEYKCRRCGNIIRNTHVPDLHLALMSATSNIPVKMNNNNPISMYDYCYNCCLDRGVMGIGICDLIGGVYDE